MKNFHRFFGKIIEERKKEEEKIKIEKLIRIRRLEEEENERIDQERQRNSVNFRLFCLDLGD